MENCFLTISQLTKRLSIAKFAVTLIFVLSGFAVMAQQGKISGIVTDDSNAPLPGVTVVIEGTSNGTTTNFDGEYTLQNLKEGDVVVFSFIGMVTQSVAYTGQSSLNISLLTDTQNLDEVVVTALGIQRDKKTLTYSSQQVSGEEMMKARDMNFMTGLSGKTAGLEIRKSTSGAGGSTRTILRGSKSVKQMSDPLYVIDGIPMINHKGGQSGMWGGTDEGDGLSQLNPDDIESISVLKGATAAVLYGSEGANGVIIITTKKGKEGKTTVTFNSSSTFESITSLPDLQYSYGSEGGSAESWSTTKGDYEDGYVEDFFRTGYNLINNLTISGGNEKMSTYFSYGNTGAGGVVPNNSYLKHNLTFKQSLKLLDNLTVTSNVMLSSEKTKNRATAGYYLNPLTGLYFFPRDRNFADYKENYQYFNTDRNMYLQNWFIDDHHQSNPYWLLNKQPKEDITKRVIASVSIDYQISDKLNFKARGSYDYSDKKFEQKFYAGGNTTNVSSNGRWNYKKYYDKQIYADGIFTYTNDFGDLNLNVIAGASYQESILGDGVSVDNGTNNLIYPNEFFFDNIPSNVVIHSIYGSHYIKQGLFGNIQLGYKNMVFLDLSGRNDWSSSLALTGNESYFYPSAGISGILTQMFDMPEVISFAKIRASGSQVNNEVPYGLIQINHTINSTGTGIDRNSQRSFIDAKPEQLVSLEFGTDWRFYDGRLGLDFTYYHITSTNQALSRTLTGSQQDDYKTSEYFNAGEIVNKGVEIVLSGTPVQSKDLTWNTQLNFSKNVNEVVELDPNDLTKYIDLGTSEGYYARIFSGGSIGDIYGYKFLRNDAGQIVLDENTGKPLKTPSEITYENREEAYLGSLEPKFSMGWSNNFQYKQFGLSFLVNAKIGGKAFSQTESMLDGYGVSQRTADARDLGYVEIDAIQGTTAVSQINPETYYTATGGRNGITEEYVYDRTNIRLTQLALSYDLDVQGLGLPLKAASFSLVGQNLFFFYKKAPFDPELGMSTDMNSQSLDNFSVPATRTYGFNLKFTF